MTEPPKALQRIMSEITHDEFRLESSLRKADLAIPESIDRSTPAFGAWLRASVTYEVDVTARNLCSPPDEEGIKPLSEFKLRVLFWERPDGMSTLWLLYPVSAASFENCKSVRSELLQAIWRDLGTFEIRHSSHVGAGMRLLFPLKEPGPDDAFDLYKALEEDELADGLVFRKFPFQRATRIATAHSGATVALCDDQIYFMYGSDYDEFSCLRIKFSRTGNFHIAKADEVKAVHDFIDLVGQRQLEWLKDGHAP